MSYDKNDVLASLFANAIRSPMPSTSSAAAPAPSPAPRPASNAKSNEPSTPRRPNGKRLPRRSTTAAALMAVPVVQPVQPQQQRKGGSVSPQGGVHLHGSMSPFAGAKFSDSPSARAIPLPPTGWFALDEDEESPCPASDNESISSFTSSSTSSSSSADALPSGAHHRPLTPSGALSTLALVGVRVNPLQLIAAAAAN